jgi:hypothetical protein
MENLAFRLRPIGLSGVDELCQFLANLERQKEIKEWHFGRHTDLSRMSIMVGFTDRQDADLASQAWNSRPQDQAPRYGAPAHAR